MILFISLREFLVSSWGWSLSKEFCWDEALRLSCHLLHACNAISLRCCLCLRSWVIRCLAVLRSSTDWMEKCHTSASFKSSAPQVSFNELFYQHPFDFACLTHLGQLPFLCISRFAWAPTSFVGHEFKSTRLGRPLPKYLSSLPGPSFSFRSPLLQYLFRSGLSLFSVQTRAQLDYFSWPHPPSYPFSF